VIGGGHRHATLAATGKRADLDRRFGIDGDASHVRGALGSLIDPVHLSEDRIGLGDFFGGRLLATFLGK
jgi:hypothetical protein